MTGSTDGTLQPAVELFLEGTGRANGMAFGGDGNLIAAALLQSIIGKQYSDRKKSSCRPAAGSLALA
jgi:hypothetical protein